MVTEDGEESGVVGCRVPRVKKLSMKRWRTGLIGRPVAELNGAQYGCDERRNGSQGVVSLANAALTSGEAEQLL